MSEKQINGFDIEISSKISLAKAKLKALTEEVKTLELALAPLPAPVTSKRIAALDGGGYSAELFGVTIFPVRAAGAVFEEGKEPLWIEKNNVDILTIEEDPKNFGSLLRDILEVEVAIELAQHKPDFLLLDGSITNLGYKGIPRSLQFLLEEKKELSEEGIGSRFHKLFLKYLRKAYELIETCIANDVILIGVSKDSRANVLVKKLYGKKKIPAISDTSLIRLKEGGKTGFTTPIDFKPRIRDIRKRIWEAANVFTNEKLQSYYLTYFILKENAIPIRVDSLLPQKDKLKDIQEMMVTYHDDNGFITPPYLTHKRAHMSPQLGERLVNLIIESVLDDSPELYQAFLSRKRRDIIQ
ncbi:hypothetical protein DRO91_01890 [Candidatus Heimdallarchaeota archaeon]|nr:MAG: hypothetical protein DRP02_04500 [Candidatus Gerdarchaeota archaeon]RLI73902.1 MAG: hypothetical protein DRO91_01890 [Candidatus Heimdallarchaeota archaeon]